MTNPLVAQAPQEGSGFNQGTGDNGWATGVSIAESAMDTFNGFKDGNWIEGGLGVVGLAADAASMAIDPFGTLMSSAASFLMEHVQPLKDMLDWLAGDPPVIESYSTTWNNVSTELGKISQDYANALQTGTEGWTGAAADAYRAAAAQQGDALTGAASAAGSVGTVVGIMGMVVAFVREMVRDLIADLVAKLIAWVLEAVFSLGFGTPVIVAQAITAISKWAARIAKLVQKLLDTIKKVSPMLKRLVEIFEKIMKVLGKLAGKVTGLDVFGTKFDDPGFLKRMGHDVDTPSGSHTGSGPSSGSNPDGPSTSPTPDGSPGSTPDGSPGSTPDGSPRSTPSSSTPDTTSTSTRTPDSTSPSADTPSTRSPDGSAPPARGTGDTTPSQTTPSTPASTVPSTHSPAPPSPTTHSPAPHSPAPHSPAPNSPDSTPSGPSPSSSPGSGPSGHSPSGNPGSSPSGHSPTGPGSTPSSHNPSSAPPTHSPNNPGGSPTTNPSSGPPRVDQTHSSATATPDAPHRTDQPHTAPPPRDPSPSSAPPQQAPGGAPHPGGQPGGSPSAGGPPRSGGGGWTGTSGHRGDTSSGVPQSRPHETPGGTSRPQSAPPPHQAGPHQARPPHAGPPPFRPQAGPPHAGPPHAAPPHAGPPQARPHQGPPHQGPPRQGPPHQNTPHQPQPRGPQTGPPQAGPPHDRGGVPPQRDPNGAPHHDSPSPDNTHPPHAPEPRPDIDEAHARHGETTPAGVSHHRGDSDMGDLPSRVPNDPRYFTADVHITPDGRARIGNHTYSPEEYGDLLRRSGWDGRTPIRLIGCDAGSNDFARRLSAHTDAPVLAPTKPAWTDSQGRVFTSDADVDANGNRRPRTPPNGEWETHSPDGTRTKASEDGFVPGTHDKDKTDLDPSDARDRAADSGGDGSEPPPRRYRDVPEPEAIRPDSPEFDRRFVDYDRSTVDERGNPRYERDAVPPDRGSPQDVAAPERDRVRDPAGPPRSPDDLPKVPDVLADHRLPDGTLPPHTQYNVTNPNGTTTKFFTDGNGDIKWVEATGGSRSPGDTRFSPNPDLDYPLLPDVQYRVAGIRPDSSWDFHTNQNGQTDSMTGTPSYGRSDPAHRDQSGDYSAQGRAGGEGRAAYDGHAEYGDTKWAGGHLAANEAGGPGEYINMFGQMNASNSGHAKDGWVNAASWRAQEVKLAEFDSVPNQRIEQYQVSMTRREDGLPEEVVMRWREVKYEADGVTVKEVATMQRVFPNVPEKADYGPHDKYKPPRPRG